MPPPNPPTIPQSPAHLPTMRYQKHTAAQVSLHLPSLPPVLSANNPQSPIGQKISYLLKLRQSNDTLEGQVLEQILEQDVLLR